MKCILSILLLLTITGRLCFAQSFGIGTTTPNNSAVLDVQSNAKGMLIPRMTTSERVAIANPGTGLLVFDNTTGSFWFKSTGNWIEVVDTLNNVWKKNGADAYVGATGNVGIGTNAPGYNLHINRPNARLGFTDANDNLFSGYVEANSKNLNINASRVVLTGSPGNLNLQTGSGSLVLAGNVGIGTLSPTAKLQVEGGTNAAATGGGYLQLGASNTINIGIDNNEIMARNNGAASKLYLQTHGGDLQIGGSNAVTISNGYQVYRNRPLSSNADLLPIAYARVDGLNVTVLSGTGNLSIQHIDEGDYRLVLLGEPDLYQNRHLYTIIVASNNSIVPVQITAYIQSDNSITVRTARPNINYTNDYVCTAIGYYCDLLYSSIQNSPNYYRFWDSDFSIMVYKK